jgi:hypothetical protein
MSFKVDGGSIGDLHLRCQSAGVNYARQREYGGEIVPKNRKFLTIPTDANKSAAGVARYPTVASLVEAFGRDRVFTLRNAGKNPVIALKGVGVAGGKTNRLNKKAGLSITPMFVLLRKVDQPGPKSSGTRKRAASASSTSGKLGRDRRAVSIVSAVRSGGPSDGPHLPHRRRRRTERRVRAHAHAPRRAVLSEKDAASPRSREINERAINVYDALVEARLPRAEEASCSTCGQQALGTTLPMQYTPMGKTDASVEPCTSSEALHPSRNSDDVGDVRQLEGRH